MNAVQNRARMDAHARMRSTDTTVVLLQATQEHIVKVSDPLYPNDIRTTASCIIGPGSTRKKKLVTD